MLKLSLVVPDATTNYIENPNCRYDTTGYNAAGATFTRVLDYARFGIASCKVVTAGTVLREGVYYRVNTLAGVSSPITASVYVIGTGKIRVRLIDNPIGKEWSSQTTTLRADRWTRVSATGFITGSNDVRLYIETDEGAAKVRTFYVGGLQMEAKAYMTTFVDGDQPGCRWNGLYHSSSSQRSGETRAGGRWVVIGGPERQEENLYMTVVGGLGVASIKNNIQAYALDAGSYFQNKKIVERLITLTFYAKKIDLANNSAETTISLDALHQLRQLLIDVIKPDRTGGDEEVLFEYDDGELPLYFKARYDGGLEGEWDIRNQWVNSFPLRLLAVSPLLYEDQQYVSQLDFQDSLTFNRMLARQNGVWNNMNYGVSFYVSGMGFGRKGEVIVGGAFQQANNNAAATDPFINANGIAYYDGAKWNRFSTGMNVLGITNPIAVGPNGYVYVGGNFTSIGGVAANRIAYWNGSAWNAMGTGLNGVCNAIAIAPNGDVYAGGLFTTAGGVACVNIARWDGTTWRRVGQYGGLNNNGVLSIVINVDGSIVYVGGSFTDQNGLAGNALVGIAQYNTATGLFSAVGSGFAGASAYVNVLRLSKNNILYAGGSFTTSGSTTLNCVAYWNGSAWYALGSGLDDPTNNIVFNMDIDNTGSVYIFFYYSGLGTKDVTIGGRVFPNIARWNGSTWTGIDLIVQPSANPFTPSVLSVDKLTGDLYFGLFSSANPQQCLISGFTSVTNLGSTEVRPVIYVVGQGKLRWIENQTTAKRLYLYLDVYANEEIFIDFAKGTIKSTVRGDLYYTMLAGSDFRSFTLVPGVNRLACFMYNDVGAQMQIQYTPQHWSADATQNVEAL